MEGKVLVTGVSGYIASHIVNQLLHKNAKVRGTVRDLSNDAKIRPIRQLASGKEDLLELVEVDLMDTSSWPEAIEGCPYVIHVASPFPSSNPKHEDEVIKPAVDGTLNVLKACMAAGCVKRVVLTSSDAAVSASEEGNNGKLCSEDDWTDIDKETNAYVKSKTLAERAAWNFMKNGDNKGNIPKFELAVMNPGLVMGPVLCGAVTTSMQIPKQMMLREMSMVPEICLPIIDVRDVAAAHIIALRLPQAAGHRHLLSNKNMWFQEIAKVIDDEFCKQGYDVPTVVAPYPLLWILGRFDDTIKMLLPEIGKEVKLDNGRMRHVLGIKPIDVKETLIDMCYSMVENGHVMKTDKYQPPTSVRL